MREGAAWSQLRKLLDFVQDTALVSLAFDARAARTGSLRKLAIRGSEVLRKQVMAEVFTLWCGSCVDADDLVASAISDDSLARLFVGLGLDSRLRRHSQALDHHSKADVLRVLVAELERGPGVSSLGATSLGASSPAEDLLRGLVGALLQLNAEVRPMSANARRVRASDVKLSSLLQRGSARAIVARLRAMVKAPRSRVEIRDTIARVLPMLCENQMRLIVFMHVLQFLCQPSRKPLGDKADAEAASIINAVAEGIFVSGIPCLPYDNTDQLSAVRKSPFLNSMQRRNLLELMMPEGGCRSFGNDEIDVFGNSCDMGNSPRSPRTGVHHNALDLASTYDPAWARSNIREPQPADIPPRPISPNVRPISPGRFSADQVVMSPRSMVGGSYVDRRPRSAYAIDTSPSSTAGSYIDRRPLKPYIDEQLRRWIPLEAPMRYDSSLSPRWYDATQKSLASPLSQSERDDLIISNICNNPHAPAIPKGLLARQHAFGYPSSAQEFRHDRALQTLCNNRALTQGFDDNPFQCAFNEARTTAENYPARLALAATRFRELASTYDSNPMATKQRRTSALLHQTDLPYTPTRHDW